MAVLARHQWAGAQLAAHRVPVAVRGPALRRGRARNRRLLAPSVVRTGRSGGATAMRRRRRTTETDRSSWPRPSLASRSCRREVEGPVLAKERGEVHARDDAGKSARYLGSRASPCGFNASTTFTTSSSSRSNQSAHDSAQAQAVLDSDVRKDSRPLDDGHRRRRKKREPSRTWREKVMKWELLESARARSPRAPARAHGLTMHGCRSPRERALLQVCAFSVLSALNLQRRPRQALWRRDRLHAHQGHRAEPVGCRSASVSPFRRTAMLEWIEEPADAIHRFASFFTCT